MKTRALYRCCAVVQVKSWLSFLGVYRSSANIRGVVVCQWNSPVPLALAHQSGEGALIRVPSLLTNTPCIHKGFLGVKIVVRERDLDRVDTYEGPSFEMPKNKSSKKGKGECSCSPRGSFCTFTEHILLAISFYDNDFCTRKCFPIHVSCVLLFSYYAMTTSIMFSVRD